MANLQAMRQPTAETLYRRMILETKPMQLKSYKVEQYRGYTIRVYKPLTDMDKNCIVVGPWGTAHRRGLRKAKKFVDNYIETHYVKIRVRRRYAI